MSFDAPGWVLCSLAFFDRYLPGQSLLGARHEHLASSSFAGFSTGRYPHLLLHQADHCHSVRDRCGHLASAEADQDNSLIACRQELSVTDSYQNHVRQCWAEGGSPLYYLDHTLIFLRFLLLWFRSKLIFAVVMILDRRLCWSYLGKVGFSLRQASEPERRETIPKLFTVILWSLTSLSVISSLIHFLIPITSTSICLDCSY